MESSPVGCPLSIINNNSGFLVDSQAILPVGNRINVLVGADHKNNVRVTHTIHGWMSGPATTDEAMKAAHSNGLVELFML